MGVTVVAAGPSSFVFPSAVDWDVDVHTHDLTIYAKTMATAEPEDQLATFAAGQWVCVTRQPDVASSGTP